MASLSLKSFLNKLASEQKLQSISPTKVGSYWTSGTITATKRGNVVTLGIGGINTTSFTSRTTIATMPAGWRPAGEIYGLLTNMTDYFLVRGDGSIQLNKGGTIVWGTITYVATQ